ncbi:hypothetical protein [Photorhabdus asymbiotica]|uniref:hypothetical protein n=1 Tax=Photorhabdus asymbiotica TaxID=291112 RepID=UPI003DA75885
MAVSGVRIQDHQGKPLIEVNDRMGRIVGYHEIPVRHNLRFKKTFSHPELAGMGEIFVWVKCSRNPLATRGKRKYYRVRNKHNC